MKALLVLTLFTLVKADFESCIENGTLVTDTICKPESYVDSDMPREPLTITVTFVFGGVKDVDEKSLLMTLNLWMNLNWKDPRLVTKYKNDINNEHIKER